jgi:NAD(P)-dependent dehydrogenase (short-subunit alcohol dehydrogenase family)
VSLCAAEGATVIVSDVRLDAVETVASAIRAAGGQAEAVVLDVTDEVAWQAVMTGIVERHGRLDVPVNNAGISVSKPIVEMTLDEWRKVYCTASPAMIPFCLPRISMATLEKAPAP